MATEKELEYYLRQLRKIEEHREVNCEKEVKKLYEELLRDLQSFLGETYAELAIDDQLTYEILHSKGKYARFLEEVEQKVNNLSPEIANEIRKTVENTYKAAYDGMVAAVKKSVTYSAIKTSLKGLRSVTPDVMKKMIENPISGLTLNDTLEKNRQTVIYDIKQAIGIGLSQGDRMSTMARRITEKVDMDYRKAIRIVRTETHRVREAGYQDASERISQRLRDDDSDYVMTKTWKTMQDEAVRPQRPAYRRKKGVKARKAITAGLRSSLSGPNHMKMHGVTILVDEEFDLGNGVTAKAPGQSGVAGHDINCRCYLSRDLMTKAEFAKLTGREFKQTEAEKIAQQEQKLINEREQLLNDKEEIKKELSELAQRTFDIDGFEYDIGDYLGDPTEFDAIRNVDTRIFDVTAKDEVDKLIASVTSEDVSEKAKILGSYFETELGGDTARRYGLTADYMLKYESKDFDVLEKHVRNMTGRLHVDVQPELDEINKIVETSQKYVQLQSQISQIDKDLLSIADDLKLFNENGLYFSSLVKEPEITKDIIKIVGKTNGELIGLDYRVKSFDSYSRKVKKEVKELQALIDDLGINYKVTIDDALLNMRDIVRYTNVSDIKDFVKNYKNVVSELEDAGYSIVRVKNTFKQGQTYKGINTIVRSPDGYEFELQFHTKQSFELKNGILHELYEKERDITTSLAEKQLLRKQMQEISESIILPDGVDVIESFDNLDDFIDLKLNKVFSDVQKRRSEIDELSEQIKGVKSLKDIKFRTVTAQDYLSSKEAKDTLDGTFEYLEKIKKRRDFYSYEQEEYDALKKFFDDVAGAQNSDVDVDGIKKLIKTKKDELKVLEKDLNAIVDVKAKVLQKELIDNVDSQIDDLKVALKKSTVKVDDITLEDYIENKSTRYKVQREYDEAKSKLERLKKEDEFAQDCITIGDRPQGISASQYLDDKAIKRFVDDEWKHLEKAHKNGTLKDWEVERYENYKKFFDDIDEYNKSDKIAIKLKNANKEKRLLEDFMSEADDYVDKLKKLEKEKEKVTREVEKFKAKYTNGERPRTASAKVLDNLQEYADKRNTHEYQLKNIASRVHLTKEEAREKLSEALTEIVNDHDIAIRIRSDNLEKVLDNGEFKNLFETGRGGGCTNQGVRRRGENDVFGFAADTLDEDRPIYGMMIPNLDVSRTTDDIWYITNGPGGHYGNGVTVVVNKSKVRHNSSFTLGDSLDDRTDVTGSLFDNPIYNGGSWSFYDQIEKVLDSSKSTSEKLTQVFEHRYMEVQIHGKENHSADIIDKVYFTKLAGDRAKKTGLLDKLTEHSIPYEILE